MSGEMSSLVCRVADELELERLRTLLARVPQTQRFVVVRSHLQSEQDSGQGDEASQ